MPRLLLLVLAIATPLVATGQHLRLSGTVRDAASGEPLAAANVRLLGTSRGTITNVNGVYTMSVEAGPIRILVSMLGYTPDTTTILMTADAQQDVSLQPSPIILPEVVVSSEDPAIEIIRRAIANKQHWIDRLTSYQMQAFTRQTLYRDTAVAAINESYTRGYWQKGDTLREIVVQQRRTANISSASSITSVGRILNFAEDEIRFVGFTFVGPTARTALEYYDYKLLRTRASHGQELYEIQMIPRSRVRPLFEGTVTIAGGTYALVGVDVTPNAAFSIPFVKDLYLRYRQQFSLYESTFWMPTDIRIEGRFSIGILTFSIPPIGIAQTSVISDYAINIPLPDSIFRKPRLVIDSSASRYDSAYWAANTVLPLSSQEQRAYRTLDSTQSLELQFRPGGATVTIGAGADALEPIFSYLDLHFNRVEGLHLGARATIDSLTSRLSVHGGLAYGFSNKRTTASIGAVYFLTSSRTWGLGADLYRRIDHRPDYGYYGPLVNSVTALFAKNDYRDYYLSDGGRAHVSYEPSPHFQADLSYLLESIHAVEQRTDFSFFFHSRTYRPNPPAVEGKLRALHLDARIGREAVPLDFVLQDRLELSVEHSSPSVTGGDFTYTRAEAVVSLSIPTFAQSYLLRPGFRIRSFGGISTGSLPVQRSFSVESSSSGYAPFGVMRAMNVNEYYGTSFLTLSLEHNFRSLPFLALGVPFLYRSGLELILYAGASRTWTKDLASSTAPSGAFLECGFSINRIFDLLRTDFTWRLTSPRRFVFTLGTAELF